MRNSPTLAQPGRASGCSGWPSANCHSAYQAYRNRVVAGSNPARGTIINFKKSLSKYYAMSDDQSWSTLDEVDQKIINILNGNVRSNFSKFLSIISKMKDLLTIFGGRKKKTLDLS